MGNKPLTWQQIWLVILSPFLFSATILALASVGDTAASRIAWPVFGGLLAIVVLLIVLHVRRSRANDIEPDILALMVGPENVMHLGDAHLYVSATQVPEGLSLLLLIQNVRAGEGKFRLSFGSDGNRDLLATDVPTAAVKLGPAAVAIGMCVVPLASESGGSFAMALSGKCKMKGSLVRFVRRTAVTKKVNPALTGLALGAGHLIIGGGTFLRHRLAPAPLPATPLSEDQVEWNFGLIWEPGDPATPDAVQARLDQAMGMAQLEPVDANDDDDDDDEILDAERIT